MEGLYPYVKDIHPENPSVGGKFILKPIGEKTRGIASLHCIQKPHGIDLTEECHRSVIRKCICITKG
jgi:hypothetical protein